MIEQGIYFALGGIVTALLALLFAPVFWRRALRLTRQRLQLQIPLSMQEIIAQRDQLRAEFAVERLRLEQAMARVHAARDADLAEAGRRTMQAAALSDEIAALEAASREQDARMQLLHREAHERDAENGALRVALHGTPGDADRWRDRAELAHAHVDSLKDEIESHRTTIAGLKTRAMGLEMRLSDSERARAAATKAQEHEASLKGRLETAMSHVARHENAGISLRRELDDAKTHIRQLEDELRTMKASGGTERDDAGLRESIHALGLAVAKQARQARDDGEEQPRRRPKDEAMRPTAIA